MSELHYKKELYRDDIYHFKTDEGYVFRTEDNVNLGYSIYGTKLGKIMAVKE